MLGQQCFFLFFLLCPMGRSVVEERCVTRHNGCEGDYHLISCTVQNKIKKSVSTGSIGPHLQIKTITLDIFSSFYVIRLFHTNSWFSRDVTKILKSKPGGLQKFYLHLRKDYLKIYSCTIP